MIVGFTAAAEADLETIVDQIARANPPRALSFVRELVCGFTPKCAFVQSALRPKGYLLLLLAMAVVWSRIYLGAHYPSDMLGCAGLGLIAVLTVKVVSIRISLWALFEQMYEALLVRLHLPAVVFPRRG